MAASPPSCWPCGKARRTRTTTTPGLPHDFPRFIYVDRIVVHPDFAGLKIGSQLYEDLFGYARSQGIRAITCEYNIQPPNPASQRFHDKFGFRELGRQWVAHGTKLVSLQAAET